MGDLQFSQLTVGQLQEAIEHFQLDDSVEVWVEQVEFGTDNGWEKPAMILSIGTMPDGTSD